MQHCAKFNEVGSSTAELSIITINRCKRVDSGHLTTSVQSTALYIAADSPNALKSCYQTAQEDAKISLFPIWAPFVILDLIRNGFCASPPETNSALLYQISTNRAMRSWVDDSTYFPVRCSGGICWHYSSGLSGRYYTVSQKKLSRFVFVRTSSNFHKFR